MWVTTADSAEPGGLSWTWTRPRRRRPHWTPSLAEASEDCDADASGGRQRLPQRRDAGGARGRLGFAATYGSPERGPALLAGQEDGADGGAEAYCAEGVVWEPSAYYSWRPRSLSSDAAGSWWSGPFAHQL